MAYSMAAAMQSTRDGLRYGQCRCCQSTGYHQIIFGEYYYKGVPEVYSDIFMECFNLFLSTNSQLSDLICAPCVARLRDASLFRAMVVKTEKELLSHIDGYETTFINVLPPPQLTETNDLGMSEVKMEDVKQEPRDELDLADQDDSFTFACGDSDMEEDSTIEPAGNDDKNADEDVEEVEIQSHSSLNEADPEPDLLANGSSDEYIPSDVPEEHEVSSSSSIVSIHDDPAEEIIRSATQYETKNTQSSCVPPTVTSCGPSKQKEVYSLSSFKEDDSSKSLTTSTSGNNIHHAQTAENESHKSAEDVITHIKAQLESVSHGTDCNSSVEKRRNKNFCVYCETQVLNFARHIKRNHHLEVEVEKILACPKKSKTRRNLIIKLIKKGNYISNVVRCEGPMRVVKKGKKETDYLPCPHCLGFYARKQLWKHKKKCNPKLSGKNSQAVAQNLSKKKCRNSSQKPSKSLEKVSNSGTRKAEAISSTKLRKQLATMGHTTRVHRQNCRLPNDRLHTAKKSKLLAQVEDGKVDAYKGKSLDDISVDIEENLESEGLGREDALNMAETEPETDMATNVTENLPPEPETARDKNVTSVCESLAGVSNTRSGSTKKKRVLVPWTTEQKNVVINHFKSHIKAKKAPKRHECDDLRALYPALLENKDWLKMKVFIQNHYSKKYSR